MQAYCMKCRSKQEMKDAKVVTMKNGKPAMQGICPVCGTRMFRIGGKEQWQRNGNHLGFTQTKVECRMEQGGGEQKAMK